MINYKELKQRGNVALRDSRKLFKLKSYDTAMYLSGYVIEILLKAVICKSLKLKGIPNKITEFSTINNLKTHNLSKLLEQTSTQLQQEIKNNYLLHWGIIIGWSPEMRYEAVDNSVVRKKEANELLDSTGKIAKVLKTYL